MNAISSYRFVTKWSIPATQERVWSKLMAPEKWPTWWRRVERVELIRPDIDALGHEAVRHIVTSVVLSNSYTQATATKRMLMNATALVERVSLYHCW